MDQIIDLVKETGAIGIATAMIIYNWRRDKLYNKTMNNHLEHFNATQQEVAGSNIKLAESLVKLSEKVERCPNR